MRKVIKLSRVKLVLDTNEYATPAMVYSLRDPRCSATYDCACGTAELSGVGNTVFELNSRDLEELDKYEDQVVEAYDKARESLMKEV